MRAVLALLACVLTLLFKVPVADAQEPARVERIKAAWLKWLSTKEVANSTLTIFYRDTIAGTFLEGDKARPVFALASLSKSITGLCVQQLIKTGRLKQSETLGDVFGDRLQEMGATAVKYADLTVDELLTQTAGLLPDDTQSSMPLWLNEKNDRHEAVTRRALGREKQQGTRGTFAYNNENYAILGAVIERATQSDYADYCRETVLKPHGVKSATPSPAWGAFAAWGGWEMTTEDFARFAWGNLGPNSPYGQEPDKAPNVMLGGGVYYGLGTFFRQGRAGSNFWHHGGLCFSRGDDRGSFFAFWRGGWGVVVAYDKCPDNSMMISLDRALAVAALSQ